MMTYKIRGSNRCFAGHVRPFNMICSAVGNNQIEKTAKNAAIDNFFVLRCISTSVALEDNAMETPVQVSQAICG